ncbi:MAG: hypothetical protein OEV93_01425 [Candidatus Moranbacteria bacterium]|nr:hypothetical protein [Candidatus Moranbacteria bacterium]
MPDSVISKKYPVGPFDIDFKRKDLEKAFEDHEDEEAARKVIQFFQYKRRWVPFALEEIKSFFQGDFALRGLNFPLHPEAPSNFIVRRKDGKYQVTHAFVVLCFLHAPVL